MSKVWPIGVVLVVIVLAAAGLWFELQHAPANSRAKADIQSKYQVLPWPAELQLKSSSFAGGSWVYKYASKAGRDTTYRDINSMLEARGYGPGGQTGEFIFTSGGDLKIAVTLEPADQNQPMTEIKITAEEPTQL